jgi:hypothetical protein
MAMIMEWQRERLYALVEVAVFTRRLGVTLNLPVNWVPPILY